MSAVRRIVEERTLGPWSAGVICLHGLGRYEHGLVGDLGLMKLCTPLLGRPATSEDTAELLSALRRMGRSGERLPARRRRLARELRPALSYMLAHAGRLDDVRAARRGHPGASCRGPRDAGRRSPPAGPAPDVSRRSDVPPERPGARGGLRHRRAHPNPRRLGGHRLGGRSRSGFGAPGASEGAGRRPRERHVHRRGCSLRFAAEEFDAVVFDSVLSHLPEPEPSIAEAARRSERRLQPPSRRRRAGGSRRTPGSRT